MIRIFIEGQELDVNYEFTHQITYAIDDIQNIDSKATAFSKTIILPGTSNNNKLLGNIFEFGNSNFTQDGVPNVGYNFNASKSAKVLVEINGLIILKGTLRLLEIVIDGENIDYEVALFGELGGFVSKLGNKKLEELDFSQYNHSYTATNIKDSWEESESINVNNSSTFSAANKTITINSIASKYRKLKSGYTITITNTSNNNSNFTILRISRSTILSKTIIYVEENVIDETDSNWDISLSKRGQGYYYPLIDYGRVSLDKYNFYYKTLRPALYVREYLDKIITGVGYTFESNFFNTDFFKRLIVPNNDNGFLNKSFTNYINASTNVNQSETVTSTNNQFPLGFASKEKLLLFNSPAMTNFSYNSGEFTYNGTDSVSLNINFNFDYNLSVIGLGNGFILVKKNNITTGTVILNQNENTINTNINIDIKANDKIKFFIYITALDLPNSFSTTTLNVLSGSNILVTKNPAGYADYQLGDLININYTIPYNILQKDFFTSILKMFNLMVTEDKYKENHLIIEPWVDFYNLDRTSYLDWSEKMDRSEPIRLKPMSEINSRYYEFKYKSDSDYYNEKYRKKFNEGYGDRKFDNQLEFSKETSTNEVIFSATPLLGYTDRDKIVPTILKWDGTITNGEYVNEEQVGSNIRIMQVKKITGVSAWDILDGYPEATGPISGGGSLTAYGYAGHLDDPDAPNVDLNFGATQELYFNLATGALSNNMFNAYYSPYMAEITDKDSRLLTAKFKLTERDIFNLDFGRFIWIDGILYRLIKIYDYSEGELCKVDLLRVIYTTY